MCGYNFALQNKNILSWMIQVIVYVVMYASKLCQDGCKMGPMEDTQSKHVVRVMTYPGTENPFGRVS